MRQPAETGVGGRQGGQPSLHSVDWKPPNPVSPWCRSAVTLGPYVGPGTQPALVHTHL